MLIFTTRYLNQNITLLLRFNLRDKLQIQI